MIFISDLLDLEIILVLKYVPYNKLVAVVVDVYVIYMYVLYRVHLLLISFVC